MSLDSDPEIAAAFSAPAPSAGISATGDPEIDSAFKAKLEASHAKPEPRHVTGIPTMEDMTSVFRDTSKGPPSMFYKAAVAPPPLPQKYNPLGWPQMLADKGADALADSGHPIAATALHMAPLAIPAMLGVGKMLSPEVSAQQAADSAFAAQSQGAAAKAPDVSKLTPETQAELSRGAVEGQTPDPVALQRIHDAETLPVPVRLMPGQAKGDQSMASAEFNAKGKYPEIASWMDDQNEALKSNIDEIRRTAAPSAVGNNALQNSQALIDKLKDVADSRDSAITAAYTKAKAANGNKLPMDGVSFLDRARTNLSESNSEDFLPGAIKNSVLGKIENKGGENMTLDDFLSARKILGNELRKAQSSSDGNAVHAISQVRDALEETPVAPGVAAEAKGLYAEASNLAKANFDDLKTNPAYKAAYNDRDVTPKGQASDLNRNFAQKYVIGGTQANLQRLRAMFGDDEEAHQTMTATALNHLKESANIDPISGAGNFSQKGYNSAYSYDVAPRAAELLRDPELAEQLEQLGRAARYTQEQTRGSSFNNSHTFVASQADSVPGKLLAGAAERVPVVGKMAADYLSNKSRESARQEMLNRILKPGAGLYDH